MGTYCTKRLPIKHNGYLVCLLLAQVKIQHVWQPCWMLFNLAASKEGLLLMQVKKEKSSHYKVLAQRLLFLGQSIITKWSLKLFHVLYQPFYNLEILSNKTEEKNKNKPLKPIIFLRIINYYQKHCPISIFLPRYFYICICTDSCPMPSEIICRKQWAFCTLWTCDLIVLCDMMWWFSSTELTRVSTTLNMSNNKVIIFGFVTVPG